MASHCKMVYRFTGIKKASAFRALLLMLQVPAAVSYTAALGWHVETDSRCLEHAARLAPFIYRIEGRRA